MSRTEAKNQCEARIPLNKQVLCSLKNLGGIKKKQYRLTSAAGRGRHQEEGEDRCEEITQTQ